MTSWYAVALVASIAGAGLLVPSGRPGLHRLRLVPGPGVASHRRRSTVLIVVSVSVVPVVAYLIGGGRAATVAGAVAIVATVLTILVRRRRATRAAQRRKREVSQACWALAGELRLGLVPAAALTQASTECGILSEPAAVARIGGNVVESMHRIGAEPGAAGLVSVARAWAVTERTGAPMEPTLAAVAKSLREAVELDQLIAGELAAPRMTGRMLAVLPVFGLTLGYVIGGDPISFLLDSLAGQVCLVVGVFLAGAGVLWTEHLANKVVSR